MQRTTLMLISYALLLFLTSCSSPIVVAIPETEGDILKGDIGADRVLTLSNENGSFTCSGEYKITTNTLGCEGREGIIMFTCSEGKTINANCRAVSCTLAQCTGDESTGKKYSIFIGTDTAFIENKINDAKRLK